MRLAVDVAMGVPNPDDGILSEPNAVLSSEVFRLKATHFQFNRYQAVQPAVEEEQIQCEILIAHPEGNFGANEAEVPAHFDEELPQAVEEPWISSASACA